MSHRISFQECVSYYTEDTSLLMAVPLVQMTLVTLTMQLQLAQMPHNRYTHHRRV
jgi:hypothetical protein